MPICELFYIRIQVDVQQTSSLEMLAAPGAEEITTIPSCGHNRIGFRISLQPHFHRFFGT